MAVPSYEPSLPDAAEIEAARVFLASLDESILVGMLDSLLPSIEVGRAGQATWLAVSEIRRALRG